MVALIPSIIFSLGSNPARRTREVQRSLLHFLKAAQATPRGNRTGDNFQAIMVRATELTYFAPPYTQSMEKFPGQEPNPENHENQEKWRGLRKFALMSALLVGGGMVGEYTIHQNEVNNLEEGHKQTFSVDQPRESEGGELTKGGRRGEFSVQKEKDGRWVIEGEIYGAGGNLVHKVQYELPASVSASQVEDTFKNISQSGAIKRMYGQSALQLGEAEGLRPMDSLIGSAEKGSIEDYTYWQDVPSYKLEVDMDKKAATETHYFVGGVPENPNPENNRIMTQRSIPLDEVLKVETQRDTYQ